MPSDRSKMRLVILECLRLVPAVNSSTIVMDSPLTCPYDSGKRSVTFPPQTPLCINLVLHGIDEG